MRQLLLLRHGEAESAAPSSRDFERALTQWGRSEVIEAAAHIRRAGLTLDAALVSPARRTRETVELIHDALHIRRISYEPSLYLGGPDTLLQTVQRCDADSQTLLLVGHNPGISELAQQLTTASDGIALRTAGLCWITLPQDAWPALAMASASSFALLR